MALFELMLLGVVPVNGCPSVTHSIHCMLVLVADYTESLLAVCGLVYSHL